MARATRKPDLHVVLLAGGSGTRFWPMSRGKRPKQLIALTDRLPLLVRTWKRVRKLAPASRIWVAAPRPLVAPIRKLLPGLRRENLIVEPSPRDTAPAVALACAAVERRDGNAVVAIFPTDHEIPREARFVSSVKRAAATARRGALVCLGVTPDRPATGFGYLKCAAKPVGGKAIAVERFVEKPNLARARRFLKSGRYLWNAGMFVWRVDRFLEEVGRTAPRILGAVRGHLSGKRGAWNRATRLSVDYAVMEKAKGVQVVPLDAGWNDVGSWDAAARLRTAGTAESKRDRPVLVDSPESVVFSDRRLVALVDVPGVVVVDTEDALLVVSRESSEKVRDVVDELKRRGRRDLL